MPLPAAGTWESASLDEAAAKQWGEDVRDFMAEQMLGTQPITTLTISGGTVTITRAVHRIDTEAAATTDDLATINAGQHLEGNFLLIAPADNGREVIVKNGANIATLDGKDVVLPDTTAWMLLRRTGSSTWAEVWRSIPTRPMRYAAKTNGSGSPYSLRDTEVDTIWSNRTATALVYFNLPAIQVGQRHGPFFVSDSDGLRVKAEGTTKIMLDGTLGAAGGYIKSTTIGDFVYLWGAEDTSGNLIWVAEKNGSGWGLDT